MRLLLTGGSKSGKSRIAQQLAVALSSGAPLYYLATMLPTDGEDEARIRRHIRERDGLGFITVECGRSLGTLAPLPADSCVLLDSVTALFANEMFQNGQIDTLAAERTAQELSAFSSCVKNVVLVADDVFRDGAGYDALTEEYMRGLALILRRLACEFDAVCEVSAGRLKVHKGTLCEKVLLEGRSFLL